MKTKVQILLKVTFILALVLLSSQTPTPAYAASTSVGDAAALIAAINTANTNNEDDVITLTADIILNAVDNSVNGATGLPQILPDGGHSLTIEGAGFAISRDWNAAAFRIFDVASGATLILNALTVSDGLLSTQNPGAGILNQGTIQLTDVTVSNNSTINHGGGIANRGTATLTDVGITGNVASRYGGGMWNDNAGTVTLLNVNFTNNISSSRGGGMYNYNTSPTLTNVDFSINHGGGGGGMYNEANSNAVLTDVTFSNNAADVIVIGNGLNGGGIRNWDSDLTLTRVVFTGNAAINFGGGIFNGNGSVTTVTSATFTGNAAGSGGGINNYASTITVTQATFSGNLATVGSGMISSNNAVSTVGNSTFYSNTSTNHSAYFQSGTGVSTLVNNTFSANIAAAVTGGLGINGGTINITNNIFANTASGVSDCYSWGYAGQTNISNLIETNAPAGGACPGPAFSGDPNLAPLADNGGFNQTAALISGSTAIDAGDAASCAAAPVNGLDQRGVSRPQGAGCDLGAYELDASYPIVASTNLSASYTTGPTAFTVSFSEDVYDPAGDSDGDDVTNPVNYLLVEEGAVAGFSTVSCAGGASANDVLVPVDGVSYAGGSFTATVSLNGGTALPDGNYRLFVCGTTSIVDLGTNPLAGDGTTSGTDYVFDFSVAAGTSGGGTTASALPETGFAQGQVTVLPEQPAELVYTSTDLVLEIPALGIEMPIVGVPQSNGTWDVSWLGENAGYLYGSAFPTWAGNTVITGHVWNADNTAGPFAELRNLQYGDEIEIHAWGMVYTYEVRASTLLWDSQVSRVFQHQDYDWVTLLTCEFYNPTSGEYLFRRSVQAVLVSVTPE